jgi:predicted MFS family arabinose efflux permease
MPENGGMQANASRAAAAGLLALAVAMGIGRFAFTPILPLMLAEGRVDLAGGSALATANYVGYFVGALLAARLSLPPRAVLRAALVAVSATTIAMAAADTFVVGLAWRFVAGVASAWVLVFASAWTLEHIQHHAEPRAVPWLAATLYSGVGIGIFGAGVACAVLASRGSPVAWLCLGILALVATIRLWGIGGESAAGRAPPATSPQGRWLLVACYGAFGFAYIVPATYLPAQARALLGDGLVQYAAWPLFGFAAAASPFVAARFGAGRLPRTVWSASQLVMAAGVAMPLVSSAAWALAASALLVGGTFMVATMAGMQEARRVGGASARALMGAMTAAFAAGQIAGPLAVGALARSAHAFTLPLAVATAALLASSLALSLSPQPRTTP